MTEGFFQPLENTKPFLKAAFQGFAGSGKTFTAGKLVVGLHKRIGSTKPIVLFDTEEAAKFLRPLFRKEGIQVLHKRSRSLADLKEAMRHCREGMADILMADSLTHVWENFLAAYQKSKNRSRLEFQDWGLIKPAWKQEFSDPFVRDPYHMIITGRAGYEYEDEKDENGKRQIYKAGIKMKVEGETAYEPDVLVLMERHENVLDSKKEVWREATILKDRADIIDGKTFRNPEYEAFAPVVEAMLDAPSVASAGPEGDASKLIQTEEDKRAWLKRRDIALEEIEAILIKACPGSTGPAKAAKGDALEHCFGTRSWTKVSGLPPELLEQTIGVLQRWLEAKRIEGASEQAS